ncbi:hypothetical protein Tsubulata_050310 [Turnera subulata]|uniref:glucan endo-1,3-beta-D-glucosidase n=1 Tax=Turnera subulata TaxID=218843 RepID=A0A9Q0FSZ2_9ROSI|nr:hypothetical protein Tsubulata_050310 [Turnera subulata]
MKIGISLLLIFALLVSTSSAEKSSRLGINYGQLGNNLPTPPRSVELIKSLKAKYVKIYDANPGILEALKNTDIQVSIMVPNELIQNISKSQSLADQWVKTNVLPFYPDVKIRYLLVGNEILTNPDLGTWFNLVPAMRRMKLALKAHNIKKVKMSTPHAINVLESSFPPSNGTFRSDISAPIMKPMLQFLNRTKSFFFVDVYPYFAWASDPKNINLDYALLESKNITYTDLVTGFTYTNLFDQMLDAVVFAMKRLGYPDIRLFIAETGWPNGGDLDQIGANIYNAATYNRNVVRRLTAKPAIGTPARPGAAIPAIIFALYNENQKPGPGTERHFGVLYPNGTEVYDLDLSGKTPESEYGKTPLPAPTNNEPYKGKLWCVVAKGVANKTALGNALSYACGQGNKTCDAIQPGKACYKPNSIVWHTSYAFSSFWAQLRSIGSTCYFDGLATQTTEDPSFGHCKFPSVNPSQAFNGYGMLLGPVSSSIATPRVNTTTKSGGSAEDHCRIDRWSFVLEFSAQGWAERNLVWWRRHGLGLRLAAEGEIELFTANTTQREKATDLGRESEADRCGGGEEDRNCDMMTLGDGEELLRREGVVTVVAVQHARQPLYVAGGGLEVEDDLAI